MSKIRTTLLFTSTLLLIASPALGYFYGSGNLIGLYPTFNNMTPSAPYSRDEYSFNRYRDEVKRYVKAAEEYVDNANNDIRQIQDAKSEAIDKANAAVKRFNDWASRGY